MRSKAHLLTELRSLLAESFRTRAEGGLHPRVSRAQGMADGYMRALLDGGLCSQKELLQLVSEERARAFGPSTGSASLERAVA
jgi:hypothetical protein